MASTYSVFSSTFGFESWHKVFDRAVKAAQRSADKRGAAAEVVAYVHPDSDGQTVMVVKPFRLASDVECEP